MRASLKSPFVLAVLTLAASQAHAGLTTFDNVSVGYAVSGDGQWATFGSPASAGGSHVFLWSAATNSLTDIGGYAGTAGRVVISADGSTIGAVDQDSDGYFSPAIYNANKGAWSLVPALDGISGNSKSSVWTLSADGRYVGGLGYVTGSSTPHGYVTDTVTGTVADLGATQARIQGIGPDAQVLIGYTTSAQAGAMWKRNADGSYALTALKDPNAPTAGLNSTAALSGNGLWAAGNSFNGPSANPYRVNTQTGEVQYFNKIAAGGGKITASVGSISADGNTIVGIEAPQLGASFGYIWKGDGTFNSATHTLGGTTMSFDDYLASYGIDTDNKYNFISIIGMNADATVFSGMAVENSTGYQTAFVVSLPVPEPSTYALLASGLLLVGGVARRRRIRARQDRAV